MVTDAEGDKWIVLDAYIEQSDPTVAKRWQGLQQLFSVNSWFVPGKHSAQVLKTLQRLGWRGHDLIDTHGHTDCCYVGEIGWAERSCYYRHGDWREYGDDKLIRLVATTETYTWEGSLLDCSIGESVFAALPSTFVQERSTLRLDKDGPSWRTDAGDVVFTNRQRRNGDTDRAFLVRADWLKKFLKEQSVTLVALGWFERRHLDSDRPGRRAYRSGYLAASLDETMRAREIKTRIERES